MSLEYRINLLICNDFDYEKSDIFSLGILIIKSIDLLDEISIT